MKKLLTISTALVLLASQAWAGGPPLPTPPTSTWSTQTTTSTDHVSVPGLNNSGIWTFTFTTQTTQGINPAGQAVDPFTQATSTLTGLSCMGSLINCAPFNQPPAP
jgi:hypothetical protein